MKPGDLIRAKPQRVFNNSLWREHWKDVQSTSTPIAKLKLDRCYLLIAVGTNHDTSALVFDGDYVGWTWLECFEETPA